VDTSQGKLAAGGIAGHRSNTRKRFADAGEAQADAQDNHAQFEQHDIATAKLNATEQSQGTNDSLNIDMNDSGFFERLDGSPSFANQYNKLFKTTDAAKVGIATRRAEVQ